MLNTLQIMLMLFMANLQDISTCVVIMVTSTIVAIGLLKPILFDKIPNKHIRKAALAFSSVAACFIAALVYFLVRGWNFDYYLIAAVALSICCILTYWLYEYTCLRNLIALIGGLVLRKVIGKVTFALTTDDVEAVKTELKKTGTELKAQVKKELKNHKAVLEKVTEKIKHDKDLENL